MRSREQRQLIEEGRRTTDAASDIDASSGAIVPRKLHRHHAATKGHGHPGSPYFEKAR